MNCEGHVPARFFLPATGQTIEILPGSLEEVELIYNEIFRLGVYTKHGVAVRAGDVVVDVGANIGMFCLHAASGADSGTSVAQLVTYYGFEALPPVFEVLRRNVVGLQEGGIMNVKALLNVAIGDQVRSSVPFTLFPHKPGNSTLNPAEKIRLQPIGEDFPHFYDGATQYLVPMRTLSDVMEEHGIGRVDLLKVDVEGAELMVLKGVDEVHWSRIRQVVVEVANADEEIKNGGTIVPVKRVHLIIHLLKKHGFAVNAEFEHDGAKNHMIYARRP